MDIEEPVHTGLAAAATDTDATEPQFVPAGLMFRVHPGAVLEGFEDGALVLRLEDRRLFELNPTAQYVLEHSDGQRDAAQVAAMLAEAFDIPESEALEDTLALYARLCEQRIVQAVDPNQEGGGNRVEEIEMSARYMTNPDVVLREEDEDGALLFNPDTNQVQVLNATGLFIWKQCDGAHDLATIVAAMEQAFEEAPAADEVAQDVREFVKGMAAVGFIGAVEQWGARA